MPELNGGVVSELPEPGGGTEPDPVGGVGPELAGEAVPELVGEGTEPEPDGGV